VGSRRRPPIRFWISLQDLGFPSRATANYLGGMDLLNIVLPVFAVIALGYILRVRGFLGTELIDSLSKLVFYVAAPALLLRSIAHTPLNQSLDLITLAVLAGISMLLGLVVYLACYRSRPARRGVLAQGSHRSNMVFMGLPIVISAYGEQILGPVSVTIGFMVMFYNFLAVLLLTLPHQDTSALSAAVWVDTIRQIFRNPLILSCLGGIVLAATGIELPVLVDRPLQLVGQIAMPLALITVGADLDFQRLRGDLIPAAAVSGLKLVVYPALVYLGLHLVGFRGAEVEIIVLIMASPTAVVSYIMAREMRGDAELAGAIVIGSTTLSLLTFLGWLILFRI